MMKCRHKGYYFILGVLNMVAMILLSSALGTNRWTEGSIVRHIAVSSQNKTQNDVFQAGSKYFGLFRGCERKKYGHYFQERTRCFNALDEAKSIARSDLVYVTLASCCLAEVILVLSIYLSFYNELVRSTSTMLQTRMPLVVFSLIETTAVGSYLFLYVHYLRKALLSKVDLADGFSTKDRSDLGYSFWLMVASSSISLLSLFILFVDLLKRGRTKMSFGSNRDQVAAVDLKPRDGPVMMMY